MGNVTFSIPVIYWQIICTHLYVVFTALFVLGCLNFQILYCTKFSMVIGGVIH
jgi:hypothetical protein